MIIFYQLIGPSMSSVDRHKPIDLGLCGLQKSRLLSFFFVFISDPTFALCLSEKIAPPIDLAAVFLLHKNLGAILCCLICYMICFVNFPAPSMCAHGCLSFVSALWSPIWPGFQKIRPTGVLKIMYNYWMWATFQPILLLTMSICLHCPNQILC